MKTKLVVLLFLIALICGLICGCISSEKGPGGQVQEPDEQIQIIVSILPQKEFVERIGGEKVDVTVMIPPGASPATYELSPGQLQGVSRAKLYVRIGHIPFEKAWMEKIKSVNSDMQVVDSSEGIEIIGNDPHIWLSPALARTQVEYISDALIEIDPDNREYYARNKEDYLKDLLDLDEDIRNNLSEIKNRKFMVYHPAWGYFARDYQLEQVPIEIEGKEPSASDLVRLTDTARANNITAVFAAPQFNSESAEVIADEIGGTVVFIDPLAKDYTANMRAVSAAFARYLK
ncbi:MAG: zinc ABC transporter substrate-binding protein [Euryarchaeota archaeon]|nr:zinc ABC transporter substrate-binding protein [Euryarchaeota archaeon]MEA3324124.1 zinc ABC transporter substrate-binding protein [Euryarchaeota archaeon]